MCIFLSSPVFFSAVHQLYTTQAEDEYVIQGNDVLIKCKVPSFVADFVSVVGWIDNAGEAYAPGRDYGKEESVKEGVVEFKDIIRS